MSRWYVPRLEGLETRQVLDAALPVPAPVPPSAALVGVANALPPASAPAADLLPGAVLYDIPATPSASTTPAGGAAGSLVPSGVRPRRSIPRKTGPAGLPVPVRLTSRRTRSRS
jgi:hypothetical protein